METVVQRRISGGGQTDLSSPLEFLGGSENIKSKSLHGKGGGTNVPEDLLKKRKSAFTLAEVLITLGIIGIVAAMTLPAFIHSYNNFVYTVKLKKAVSFLEQRFTYIMASEMADSLEDTSLFQSITWAQCEEGHYPADYGCETFFNELNKALGAKEFLPTEDLKTYMLDGRDDNNSKGHYYLILPDGSAINHYFRFWKKSRGVPLYENIADETTGDYMLQGYFRFDINGTAKPNKYGRDIFWFDLTSTGHLVPKGSMKYSMFNNHDDSGYWKKNNSCGPSKHTTGDGCGARVIENGWDMDY